MVKTRCRVCESADAKYRCPACELETCNVSCAKRHKNEGCNGRREIKRKAISEMTDNDLVSDVSFLQRVGLEIESGARLDSMLQSDKYNLPTPVIVTGRSALKHSNALPIKVFKQKAAESHVILRLAPASLTRRKENTTTLTTGKNSKRLRWKVEWILTSGNGDSVHTYTHDDKAISQDSLGHELMSRFRKERGIIAKAGIELATRFVQSPSLSVLMRDESLPSHERGWLLFDPDKRLKEWLAGTLIVEYPTFYVVPSDEIEPPVETAPTENMAPSDTLLTPHWKPTTDASRGEHIGNWRGQKVYRKLYAHSFQQGAARLVEPAVDEEEVPVDLTVG